MLTWRLFSFVPYSTVKIHICIMLLKHPLPVMKYLCPPPKGLQHSKSVCPSADRQSVLQSVAMGFAVRSSQIQTADLCPCGSKTEMKRNSKTPEVLLRFNPFQAGKHWQIVCSKQPRQCRRDGSREHPRCWSPFSG